MSYQDDLNKHLADYKRACLGITELGIFQYRGRNLRYEHILPVESSSLNLLDEARDFLNTHRHVKLHRYFHHLNSSQAFAFNLFFPYFSGRPAAASALLKALGCAGVFAGWEPEWIPDAIEGTNTDMCWWTRDDLKTLCEVKLSEADFGKAPDDARHRLKFLAYRERLAPHIEPARLERHAFFDAYQFYRNIWHMLGQERSRLVFLLPRANAVLWNRLAELRNAVVPGTQDRISVVDVGAVITRLCADEQSPREMREYAAKLKQKYVLESAD
jgi:hypothetical protein